MNQECGTEAPGAGGLGVLNPAQIREKELKNSYLATKPSVNLITERIMGLTPEDT